MHPKILAALIVCLPATAFADPISGTFTSDRAGMEQKATITSGKAGSIGVKLSVSAERCIGELDAKGKMRGDALITEPPNKQDSCRLTIRKTADGIRIDEDKCLYWHGAACEFSGPYKRQ